MSHSVLVESSHNIATARLAIQKSDIVLNARKPKLAAVMESQQEVVAAMGALSTPVPTELAGEVSSLRAGLSERSTTLRRMVNNLLSEDEDQPSGDDDGGDDKPKGEVPPQFQKKDGEGDDKEGAVAEQIASILKAEGLDAKSIANVLEELATRCATYQRQLEGAVPRDKYRTAIRLGEAVVARAKSDKQVYEGRIAKLGTELAESRRTEKAATAMLEATVSRYRTEKVEGVVEELISKNPRLRPIESKLRECKDVGELTSLVESTVKPLVEGKPNSRPDLPLPHGNGLNEDRTPKRGRTSPAPNVKQNSGGNGLMEMLTESERGGYVKV